MSKNFFFSSASIKDKVFYVHDKKNTMIMRTLSTQKIKFFSNVPVNL